MLFFLRFSDSLAFATEPVMGSLANILGNFERMPAMIPQELKVDVLDVCQHASSSHRIGYDCVACTSKRPPGWGWGAYIHACV